MSGHPFRIVTCEHGGRHVPAELATLFEGQDALLSSHRGWDPGALELFRRFERHGADAAFFATTTRLVVDLNRSEGNPRVFSAQTRTLGASEREALLERFHRPHRAAVAEAVESALARGLRALHVGIHSFTPVLGRSRRDFDIGILYDPSRPEERQWARAWGGRIRAAADLEVRYNRPYRGTSDGLTTTLRRRFGERYLGIELEMNQRLWNGTAWPTGVVNAVVETAW